MIPGREEMIALAVKLWGEPTKKGRKELRFGRNGSKALDLEKLAYFDHEAGTGGGFRELYKEAHGTYPPNGEASKEKPKRKMVTAYDYRDESGALKFQVVRYEPKEFKQRRPDANGGWIWKLEGVKPILYRLPELIAADPHETVFIPEGEKDVDALRRLGLIATCNPGGAGKWCADYARYFQGRLVAALADNDEGGRRHVRDIAASLRGVAARVVTLELPRLPPKGDVSNWLDAGGTREVLLDMAAKAWAEANEANDDHAAYAGLLDLLSAETWIKRDLPPADRLLGDLVTTTSRVFIVGRTGLGKTMLGLAMALGIASGAGFLHWRSSRPARVLYIDGEMPRELLQQRIRDAARRIGKESALRNVMIYSAEDAEEIARRYPMLGEIEPLNTEAGQNFIKRLCGIIKPDVVIFDNVQALVAGVQKEEETWIPTLDLVLWLTAQRIGQIWFDHTGHSAERQYGTATKSWRFDVVGLMAPLSEDQRAPNETAFTLSFDPPGKARRRTPDNWNEFAPHTIRLREDQWTSEPTEGVAGGKAKIPPSRAIFHSALLDAIAHAGTRPGETTKAAWESECVRRGLIEASGSDDDCRVRDRRRAPWRKAMSDLLAGRWIAIDDERVMDLTRTYP
jgi:hypothetical protein